MDNNRLIELFASYHKGTATAAETEELMAQLQQLPDEKLEELLRHTWDAQDAGQPFFAPATREKFIAGLQQADGEGVVRSINTGWRMFLRIAAAAVVILMLSVTAVLLLRRNKQDV